MRTTFHVRLALAGIILMTPAACLAEAFTTTKIKQCAIEYRAEKAKGPVESGWPKFWSACSKSHNAAGDTFLTRKQAATAKAAE